MTALYNGRRETGVMLSYSTGKGYGFIEPDWGSGFHVFVGKSDVEAAKIVGLRKGVRVEYELRTNASGKCYATDLRVLADE